MTRGPLRSPVKALGVFLALVVPFQGTLAATPGHLDQHFAASGVAYIDYGRNEYANAVFAGAGGAITLIGTVGNSEPFKIGFSRLSESGQLDRSFGRSGKRIVQIGQGKYPPLAFGREAGGKYLAFGFLRDDRYYVARFSDDGTLDQTYGDNGIASGAIPSDVYQGALLALPSGRLVLAGIRSSSGHSILWALNSTGRRVARFGNHGTVGVPYEVSALALEGGDVLVAGSFTESRTIVVRAYDENGARVIAYGRNGQASITASTDSHSTVGGVVISVDAEGAVDLAGELLDNSTLRSNVVAVRLTEKGHIDLSFGRDGLRTIDIGALDLPVAIVPIEPSRFVIAGWISPGLTAGTKQAGGLFLAGFRSDGEMWRAFGSNGIVRRDFGDTVAEAALLMDKALVVVGGAKADFFAARFLIQ